MADSGKPAKKKAEDLLSKRLLANFACNNNIIIFYYTLSDCGSVAHFNSLVGSQTLHSGLDITLHLGQLFAFLSNLCCNNVLYNQCQRKVSEALASLLIVTTVYTRERTCSPEEVLQAWDRSGQSTSTQ